MERNQYTGKTMKISRTSSDMWHFSLSGTRETHAVQYANTQLGVT